MCYAPTVLLLDDLGTSLICGVNATNAGKSSLPIKPKEPAEALVLHSFNPLCDWFIISGFFVAYWAIPLSIQLFSR